MECCICWHPYDAENRPFVGNCGHSICGRCLPNMASTNCPTCRIYEAFEDAPENYLAKDLLNHIATLKETRRGPSSSPDDSIIRNTAQSRAEHVALQEAETSNPEQIQYALSSAYDFNASLQKVIEDLSEQNESLKGEIIKLTKLLHDEKKKRLDLSNRVETIEESLQNRQRALEDLRRRTRTQFHQWNREFGALNAAITRTTEEQDESSDASRPSSASSNNSSTTRSISSNATEEEDTSDDDGRLRRIRHEECSIM